MFQCLVASVDEERRDRLANSAVDGGWETVKFSDPQAAARHVKRRAIRLAIVDLEGAKASRLSELRDLVTQLAGMKDLLLVVSGHQGQTDEEIWARQLGIWLYLPGVTGDSDVGFLCGEARDLTARLTELERNLSARNNESTGTE